MSAQFLAPALDHLASRLGNYVGNGKNEAGQAFKAKLTLLNGIEGASIEIRFRAEDEESAFHEERTWIALDLLTDQLCLWTVSTNAPGVLRHDLIADEVGNSTGEGYERRWVFRHGQADNTRIFRQEIALELWPDGRLDYHYAWAIPHETLKPRVHATLRSTH